MNDISSDDIFLLKQRLAEQEALIHALQEKLSNREREIDHLQAQLDKLRRMNFGSRSEKVSRRIAQMEADLNRLQKESDTLTGRVYDPAVQRPLRQTRTRKPFPESLPRDEKRTKRLERGRFAWPSARDGKVFLTPAQLAMLLEGIDWRQPKRLLTSLTML
ncbi:hypothetical protein GUB53_25095 [Escherichia coli]|nr:hypothetical protein [Escherichia coli]